MRRKTQERVEKLVLKRVKTLLKPTLFKRVMSKIRRGGLITLTSLTILISSSANILKADVSKNTVFYFKKVFETAQTLKIKGSIDEEETEELRNVTNKALRSLIGDLTNSIAEGKYDTALNDVEQAISISKALKYNYMTDTLNDFKKIVEDAKKTAINEYSKAKLDKMLKGCQVKGQGWGAYVNFKEYSELGGKRVKSYINVIWDGSYRILNGLPITISKAEVAKAVIDAVNKNRISLTKQQVEYIIKQICTVMQARGVQ